MIYDMANIILSYSLPYTRKTYEKFTHNGITYINLVSTSTISGILAPLDSKERVELLQLGHIIDGKMNFYVPVPQGLLTENDTIVDSNGVEWCVEPHDRNYADLCNIVKYRVTRKI